jgi:transcriptional regulator with XRE-family HTH domain
MATTPEESSRTLSHLVAEEIRVALTRQRLSQRRFAARLGVSPAWVNYRLTGQQEIGLNDLSQIASVLGVDLDELLTPDVKAKATQKDKGANGNFDPAPADALVTVGQGSVGMATRVTRPPKPKQPTRPNGHPKPGTTRPPSTVPPRKRRPAPVGR